MVVRSDEHPQFRQMVVVVFSVSDTPDDIRRAYHLGADSYLLKPVGFPELVEKVRMLSDYWLKANMPAAVSDRSPVSVKRKT